jgi:hypothetical protein
MQVFNYESFYKNIRVKHLSNSYFNPNMSLSIAIGNDVHTVLHSFNSLMPKRPISILQESFQTDLQGYSINNEMYTQKELDKIRFHASALVETVYTDMYRRFLVFFKAIKKSHSINQLEYMLGDEETIESKFFYGVKLNNFVGTTIKSVDYEDSKLYSIYYEGRNFLVSDQKTTVGMSAINEVRSFLYYHTRDICAKSDLTIDYVINKISFTINNPMNVYLSNIIINFSELNIDKKVKFDAFSTKRDNTNNLYLAVAKPKCETPYDVYRGRGWRNADEYESDEWEITEYLGALKLPIDFNYHRCLRTNRILHENCSSSRVNYYKKLYYPHEPYMAEFSFMHFVNRRVQEDNGDLSAFAYYFEVVSQTCKVCGNRSYTNKVFKADDSSTTYTFNVRVGGRDYNSLINLPSCTIKEHTTQFNFVSITVPMFANHEVSVCTSCNLENLGIENEYGSSEPFENSFIFVPKGVNIEDRDKSILRRCHTYYGAINDYNYKPNKFEFLNVGIEDMEQPRLYMGVELEFDNCSGDGDEEDEGWSYKVTQVASMVTSVLTNLQPHAYLMHDGSLDNGFEIGTMPATLKAHMSKDFFNYGKAFALASEIGADFSHLDEVGMHVHINRAFFGSEYIEQMYRGALLTYLIEKHWSNIYTISNREGNNWCEIKSLVERIDYNVDDNNINSIKSVTDDFSYEYGEDKYVIVNLKHEKTFELRFFAATNNEKLYFARLQLISNMAHFVKGATFKDVKNSKFVDIVKYNEYEELNSFYRYLK